MKFILTPIIALAISIPTGELPAPPAPESGRLASHAAYELIDEYLGFDRELSFPVQVTGYSSTKDQCDDSPFITAANTRVRDGIVALSRDLLKRYTPDAPFDWGDRIHLEGIGSFIVEDSMNARYTRRVDIWFPDRKSAWRWGLQDATLIIPPDHDHFLGSASPGSI